MEHDAEPSTGLSGVLAQAGRLDAWLHVALILLTLASVWRYLIGHGFGDNAPIILAGAAVLLVVYVAFPWVSRSGSPRTATVWCLTLIATWSVLVVVAPSFSWVAVTLAFVALRVLRFPQASAAVGVMMVLVIVAWTRMQGEFNPTIVVGPICIAGLGVLAYRLLERESASRQRLLDELREAQGDLADAQHNAGVLAERTRLSREIHDSVAQGLTSINLLLQAAEREWNARPRAAHDYVGQAACTSRDSLDEVRRVVRDLAPAELAEGDHIALTAALRRVGEQVTAETTTAVAVHIHGEPQPLPADVSTALLRSARGALANIVEHAAASEASISLTYQPDAVSLDIRDNGVGFNTAGIIPNHNRGQGLAGIRSRARHFDGQLAVESTLGDGTTIALSIPLPATS